MSKKHKKSDKKGNVFDPKSPASKALAIALSGAMVTAGTPLPVFAAENQSVSQPSEPDATSADETSSQAAAAQETAATTTQESASAASTSSTTAAEEAPAAAATTKETAPAARESAAETSASATTAETPAAASTATTATAEETAASEDTMPAQELEESVAVGTDTVAVHVSAPEGALPKDAKLVLETVDAEDLADTFESIASASGNEVSALKAVRVSYASADGSAVTPAAAVEITLTDADPSTDATTLWSMASETAAPVKEEAATAGKATATSSAASSIYVLESEKAAPAAADDSGTSDSVSADDASAAKAASGTDEATSTEEATKDESSATEETSESEEAAGAEESSSTDTAETSTTLASALSIDSLLGVSKTAAATSATVTFVNDNDGTTTTGTLEAGNIAANAAASGTIPAGYAFDHASIYNTDVVSFSIASDGTLLAMTADGSIAQIAATKATDLQVHYRGSYAITYKYTIDGKEATAADAGLLVGPSGVTPNGTANIAFTPATGLSVDSVTSDSGTITSTSSGYTLSGVNGATTVTVNLSSQHTLTFANSSNTYLTYGDTRLNSKNGGSLSYTTGSSVSFQLDMYNQWSSNPKVLNKLTITLASGEVMANIPPTNGTATTTLSDGTTITVTRSGSSSAPSYKVTITAASGKNVYGNISVSTNYKDQATSEVWVNQLVGVDYVTSDYGTANHVDGNKLYPGIFDFYVRDTRYSSTFTFTVKDGYTLSTSGVTITARDQNGNLLTNTSGHWSLKPNGNGFYTITIGADARSWKPKDIRISIVATPDATTTYTTSYDDADASGSYSYNGSFTIPECTTTKQGQHFTGWVLEGDTSGKVYKPGDTFTINDSNVAYASNGNFHFVSQWTQNGEANVTVNVKLHNADGTTTNAGSATAVVAIGAAARIDQSQVEAIVAKAAGSDWASTYEPLDDGQFSVSSAADGQTITIVYCAKISLVNADSIDTTYDGQAHTLSASASVPGATIEYSTDNGKTWSTTAPSRTDAGTTSNISVRASKAGYKTVQKDGLHISVAQRPVTVTANNYTKKYGEDDPSFSATVSGTLNNDTVSYTLSRAEGEKPGRYAITPSGEASQGNYSVTFTPGTLIITPADITDQSRFEASNPSDVTYNGQEQKQGITVKDTKTGATLVEGTDYDLSYNGDTTNVGTVNVTVTGKGNYSGTVERSYKINARNVTLTSASDSKAYDGTPLTNNDVTISGDGFVAGEGATYSVTGTITNVGKVDNDFTYTLNDGTLAKNYIITQVKGTLEVSEGNIADEDAFTVSQPEDTKYNGQEQKQPVTVSFKNGGAVDASNYDVAYTPAVDAGTVTVTVTGKGNLTGSVTRSYEIQKRDVTLTSASDSKTYDGKPLTNHTVTATGDGFVEGEGASYDVTGTITNAGSVANAFTYTLNDNTKAANYNITKAEGTLTVNQADEATVHVTGESGSFTYDGTQKSVEGWASDAASVDSSISVSLNDGQSAVAQGTNVGTYSMGLNANKFTAISPNYKKITVEVTDGTLTITAAAMPATVTGESQTITYDGQEHELIGYTTSGLLDGQTLGGLTYSAKGTAAGTYTGTFAGTVQVKSADGTDQTENYVISQVPGTLTITAAEINPDTPDPNDPTQKRFTITAPEDVTYNGTSQQQKPAVHDATTGKDLVEGTDYELSYSKDTTDAGTVTVTIKGKGNYAGSVDTAYEIKQAKVVVKAADASKNYGEEDPAFSATVSGLVNNESESLISYSLTREAGEAKGTYAITPSGAESQGNYSVTYENGTLTINAAEINPDTPDPNDPTNPDAKRFTISKPADTVYNGLSQKDGVTVHDAATGKDLELGTDYTLTYSDDTTNVGTVTVTVNGTGNYSGTVAQTYKITPATLTVTTPDASKSYDGTPLTAEGTVSGFVNNEAATFTTTGSQTEVGKSDNTYTLAFDQTAKESNYTVSKSVGKLEVTAGNISDEDTFTVSQPEDTKYNGQEQKQPVTVSFTKSGDAVDSSDYTITYSEDVTDAGTVTVTITGRNNLSGTVTRTYQITPATLTVTTPDASKAYDGTPLTAAGTISGFVNGERATFTTTGSQTEVGKSDNTYTLAFDQTAKESNYTVSATEGTLEVTKGNISDEDTFTVSQPEDTTYNGLEQRQPVSVTFAKSGDAVSADDYTVQYTPAVDAGTVTVTITGRNNLSGTVTRTYQITPATLTVTTPDASKAYDGTPLTAAGTISGFVNGERATFTTTGSQTEVGKSDNTYTLAFDQTAKESNYTVSATTGMLEVTKGDISKYVTLTPSDVTVTYDGEAHTAGTATATDTNGNALTIEYSTDGKTWTENPADIAATNVLDSTTVQIRVSAGNYEGYLTGTEQLTIKKAPVTITTGAAEKAYDGTPLTDDQIEVAGLRNGETVSVKTTGTITEPGSTPNTYDITWASEASAAKHGIASFIQSLFAAPAAETTAPTAKQSNYEVTDNLGALTVTKASVDSTDGRFTVEGLADVKYDGASHEEKPVVTDTKTGAKLVEGTDYKLTYSDDTVNAGTVTVTVTTLPTSEHYTGSVSRTYNILKRDVTLTSASDKKSYDGTPLTNDHVTVAGEDFADGEGADFDVTGTITNVGTVKNTFAYTLKDGTKAGNYNITKTEGTLTVSAGNIADEDAFTVGKPEDTTYNGQEQKQPVTVSFKNGGAVSTDDYTVSYSEDTVNAGTVTVTITGKGNLSGQVTREYQILPKGYTVTTEDADKTYDGTALTAPGEVEGIVDGETYTFETTGSQTDAGSSDNTYTLTFDGTAKAGNYKLEGEALGTLTVNAAEIDPDTPDPNDPTQKRFTITAPEDVTYNGTSQQQKPAVHDATTGKDLVEGTDYELSYSKDTTDAGTVTVTIKGKGNYAGSVDTAYEIKQAKVTVTANDATKVAGESDPAFTAKVDGLVKGESESLIKYELTREPGETPGTYAIKVSGEESQGNYSVTFVNGTLTITEAPATPEPQKPETPKAEPEPAKQETAKVPDTSDTNAQAPVGFMAALSAALMAMGVHLRRKSRDDEE
ncbi:MAG: MBG domain-containing protein [Atopobiaceae bacterium]